MISLLCPTCLGVGSFPQLPAIGKPLVHVPCPTCKGFCAVRADIKDSDLPIVAFPLPTKA